MQALYDTILKYRFKRYDECFATSLLFDDGRFAVLAKNDSAIRVESSRSPTPPGVLASIGPKKVACAGPEGLPALLRVRIQSAGGKKRPSTLQKAYTRASP